MKKRGIYLYCNQLVLLSCTFLPKFLADYQFLKIQISGKNSEKGHTAAHEAEVEKFLFPYQSEFNFRRIH